MSSLNIRVKKTLEDIIDLAYRNEPEENRDNYKRFYIKIITKECKSRFGCYRPANRTIEVSNLSRGSNVIVKTCIHELAHHLDNCKNGKTGHQAPFYEEYAKLLYAALNMKLFTADDIRSENTDSSDASKVLKILDEWVPNYVEYKTDSMEIKVLNAFEIKNELKTNGYSWDGVQKAWVKEVSEDDLSEEEVFLQSLDAEYNISSSQNLNIEAIGYIIADGNTYDTKDNLKEEGFFFHKKGKKAVWKKKVILNQAKEEISRQLATRNFNGVTFSIGK